jgi:hypothetical protein
MVEYLMYVTRNGNFVTHKPTTAPDEMLTRPGTKIHACLLTVMRYYPQNVCTAQIATECELARKETAALMIALMLRSIVDRVEDRKGIPGGSLWRLSPQSELMMAGYGVHSGGPHGSGNRHR